MMKMLLTLNDLGVQLEEDFALINLIQNYKSKLMRNIKKNNWMIVISYLMKRKIKKKNLS